MDLDGWVARDRAYWLLLPGDRTQWKELLEQYVGPVSAQEFEGIYQPDPDHVPDPDDPDPYARRRNIEPFRRALEVAREAGAKSVVIENRYVDADFRSEYSAFWSLRFTSSPQFTRRIHFFAAELNDDGLHRLTKDERESYLGYIIVRPIPQGPLGRTLLVPPKTFAKRRAVLADVPDEVSFFGSPLEVCGIPFAQQDGEFVVCAHTALWTCHYIAFRKGLVGRRTTAELATLAPKLLSPERTLPSGGMNTPQMQAVFSETGQPALMYRLGSLPTVQGVSDPEEVTDELPGRWDTRVVPLLCRYLNSGIPILVGTHDHAFVVVGYFDDDAGGLNFVICDDQSGPYVVVTDPLTDDAHGGTWEELMIPLPPKVFLTAESAENNAFETLVGVATASELMRALHTDFTGGKIALRTFLVRGRTYKERLSGQRRNDEVVRKLRLARLSNWVWVVEAHDRELAEQGEPHVRAEFVYDSTSYDREPRRLAVSYPEATIVLPPGDGERDYANTGEEIAWDSQMPVVPRVVPVAAPQDDAGQD